MNLKFWTFTTRSEWVLLILVLISVFLTIALITTASTLVAQVGALVLVGAFLLMLQHLINLDKPKEVEVTADQQRERELLTQRFEAALKEALLTFREQAIQDLVVEGSCRNAFLVGVAMLDASGSPWFASYHQIGDVFPVVDAPSFSINLSLYSPTRGQLHARDNLTDKELHYKFEG